jgi:hypothetical protein
MATASGYTMEIPFYEIKGIQAKCTERRIINPGKVSCWLPKAKDIWMELGIFEENKDGEPILRKPHYFSEQKKTNFFWNYLKPFINEYAKEIRSEHEGAFIFFETDPMDIFKDIDAFEQAKHHKWKKSDAADVVNASHWYDGFTLYSKRFMKHFNVNTQTAKPLFFYRNIRRAFSNQLKRLKDFSVSINDCPTLIGEFGIPYNMYKKRGFSKGDWRKHIDALTLSMDCMDDNILHFTLWNYTANNCNEWGDLWNQEDLSIFSRDQQDNPEDINSGGRAIEGFCRPYARNVTGRIISMSFNRRKKHFKLEYENNPKITDPTIIYVPNIQYPDDYMVHAPGSRSVKDRNEQILEVHFREKCKHKIEIKKK